MVRLIIAKTEAYDGVALWAHFKGLKNFLVSHSIDEILDSRSLIHAYRIYTLSNSDLDSLFPEYQANPTEERAWESHVVVCELYEEALTDEIITLLSLSSLPRTYIGQLLSHQQGHVNLTCLDRIVDECV